MKKIIILLSALLIVSIGYSKEYNTGLTTVKSPQLGRVLADNPERSIMNIGNWAYFMRDNGESAHTPSSNSGGFYPRGTAAAIYLDGILVGGYQDGKLKVSGQIYRIGTERGYIDANGNHIGQAQDPRVRIYRIRKDWETLTADQVRQDAAEQAEIEVADVTDAQIQTILDQYETDWNEWPTGLGAPFYDNNDNGVYEPELGETPGIADADQIIWLVITDADTVTTRGLYGTDPIGIEQQITMWGYNQPGGGLGQIIFKQIRLINKGVGDLEDAYISVWSDPDVGDYSDDLVGVDVDKSLMFAYNGGPNDDQYDAYGLAPPAAGYDFFAGPIVEAPGETAIFDLKEKEGYMNLPASSFGFFVAGGEYSDPDPYGDVEAAREYYNLMRGFAPLDDLANPTPWLDQNGDPTLFPFSGDPVAGTGHLDSNPADRRMLINSGPFVLAEGDTQDIVVAVVGGLGNDNLTSITAMKSTDEIAQKLFDDLFSSVPSSPAAPQVKAKSMDQAVILEWGSDPDAVFATENNPRVGYEFQGYNVYQLPNASASKDQATRIATFDVVDGVTTIYGNQFLAQYGETVNVPVQFGLDTGIKRSIGITKDWITSDPLYNGSEYYFAVTAYNYNAAPDLIEDQALESALVPVLVKIAPAPIGTEYTSEYGDVIQADHTVGVSDGDAYAVVVDPSQVTGNDYSLYFELEHYYLDVDGVWKSTAEPDAVAKLLDVSPSTVIGSAVTGAGGTLDLNFEVLVVSPDYNYASGVLITLPPGVQINSATGPSGVAVAIQADGRSVLFGDLDADGAGDFAGGEVVTINVSSSSVTTPIAFDFEIYDDEWAQLFCDADGDGVTDPDMVATCDAYGIGPGYTVVANATGSGTIDEIGYQFKTVTGWYAKNTTTGMVVTPHTTIQSGVAGDNIYNGVFIPEHAVGADEGPIAEGLRFHLNGPPQGFKSVDEIMYDGTVIDPVDNVWHSLNSNATYFISAGGSPGDFSRWERYITYAAPRDFEMRFTDGPNWGAHGFTDYHNIQVPFELWDIGIATPDDPSDDYRMMPFIYENASGTDYFSYEGDVDGYFGYPCSDWIYWMDFVDQANGYNDFAADAAAAGAGAVTDPDGEWGVNFYGGFVYPIGRYVIADYDLGGTGVPSGTTIRIQTKKPNTLDDTFALTAPANTTSNALIDAAIDKINVFPNPYYANNSMESNRFDNFVTFNHLPQKATIKIFSLDGKIIRTLEKDNASQYLEWDLRNHADLPVASGVYIAHIDLDVDGQNLGSKVLKLFIIQADQILEYY